MLQKRLGSNENSESGQSGTGELVALGEAARSAAAPPLHKPHDKHDDEKVSLFWRVFGGAILSMVMLGVLTLYNSLTSNISELRAELNREREARAELVRKDEFNTRTSTQYERIRALDGLKAEYEGLKERVAAGAGTLESLRKETAAGADAAKKDAAALEVLREKVNTSTADLKTAREDVAKIQQELERNRAADLERKSSRDSQYRQVEEALKELQKALQDCREKLARLEGGVQPVAPKAPARPTGPGGE